MGVVLIASFVFLLASFDWNLESYKISFIRSSNIGKTLDLIEEEGYALSSLTAFKVSLGGNSSQKLSMIQNNLQMAKEIELSAVETPPNLKSLED